MRFRKSPPRLTGCPWTDEYEPGQTGPANHRGAVAEDGAGVAGVYATVRAVVAGDAAECAPGGGDGLSESGGQRAGPLASGLGEGGQIGARGFQLTQKTSTDEPDAGGRQGGAEEEGHAVGPFEGQWRGAFF